MTAIHRILVPLDLSDTSERVLDFARMLADACGASLHLLHVIPCPLTRPDTIDQERCDACRRLDALLDRTDRDSRHATTACHVGTPAYEIVRCAAGNAIDLIVMGTHTHGPTFQMATGSIAEIVIGLAPCPVLTIKGIEEGACDMEFDAVVAAINPRRTVE